MFHKRELIGEGMTGELMHLAKRSIPVTGLSELLVPALVAGEGERAATRYVEFFTAQIRNPNTRAAYARACDRFLAWCEMMGFALPQIGPVHVATYVETLGRELSAPTVKQQLAAIRMLFDWLVTGQVVPHNPAASVRGPRHSTTKGKTRMPTREEAKALLAVIPTDTLVGLRDRAARALVAAQAGDRADVLPGGVAFDDQFGERGGIEQAEVDPLAGERMHDVCGIADQCQPRLHVVLRMLQPQREGHARPAPEHRPEPVAEGLAERMREAGIVERQQLACLLAPAAPDDRAAAVVHRQEGQRSAGQEALPAGVAVRLLAAHATDHGLLLVAPAHRVDAGPDAQRRLRTVGQIGRAHV